MENISILEAIDKSNAILETMKEETKTMSTRINQSTAQWIRAYLSTQSN